MSTEQVVPVSASGIGGSGLRTLRGLGRAGAGSGLGAVSEAGPAAGANSGWGWHRVGAF